MHPESDPFVVVKAKQLTLTCTEDNKCSGNLEDFFTLMGDADYLMSTEGQTDHYVLCWFDDNEPDMTKDLRRLRGVTLTGQVHCAESPKTHKRTYNGFFTAQQAKLK